MAPGAPEIHPGLADYQAIYPYIRYGNVCMDARLTQGDVARGFAEADRIFEDTYRTAAIHQAPFEPHACLAEVDEDGRITVWTGTQQLSVTHTELALALDLPMTSVRVIPVWSGGGFGGRLKTHLEQICALLARTTRQAREAGADPRGGVHHHARPRALRHPHQDRRQERWHHHGQRGRRAGRRRRLLRSHHRHGDARDHRRPGTLPRAQLSGPRPCGVHQQPGLGLHARLRGAGDDLRHRSRTWMPSRTGWAWIRSSCA